jgi:hypothetical protein
MSGDVVTPPYSFKHSSYLRRAKFNFYFFILSQNSLHFMLYVVGGEHAPLRTTRKLHRLAVSKICEISYWI